MRLLANENIETACIEWLREMGHDIAEASKDLPSVVDSELIEWANEAERVLLTRDTDFGHLVYIEQHNAHGVILVRLQAPNQYVRLSLFQDLWPEIEANAIGHFVVVSNDRIRIRQLHPVV